MATVVLRMLFAAGFVAHQRRSTCPARRDFVHVLRPGLQGVSLKRIGDNRLNSGTHRFRDDLLVTFCTWADILVGNGSSVLRLFPSPSGSPPLVLSNLKALYAFQRGPWHVLCRRAVARTGMDPGARRRICTDALWSSQVINRGVTSQSSMPLRWQLRQGPSYPS